MGSLFNCNVDGTETYFSLIGKTVFLDVLSSSFSFHSSTEFVVTVHFLINQESIGEYPFRRGPIANR